MPLVLEAHVEGSSLRGISPTVNLAYNTVISLVRAACEKGQMIHNAHVQNINTSQMSSDEFWSFVQKKRKQCQYQELAEGNSWVGKPLERTNRIIRKQLG